MVSVIAKLIKAWFKFCELNLIDNFRLTEMFGELATIQEPARVNWEGFL